MMGTAAAAAAAAASASRHRKMKRMNYSLTLMVLFGLVVSLPVVQCKTVASASPATKKDEEKIYWLYSIPSLEVNLLYDESFAKENGMSKLDDLLKIGQDLDTITTDFLSDKIEQSLIEQKSTQTLHTLQLDVVVRLASQDLKNNQNRLTRRRRHLRASMVQSHHHQQQLQRLTTSSSGELTLMFEAEVSGHAALTAPTKDHSSGSTNNIGSDEAVSIDKSLVKDVVNNAFATEASRNLYMLKIQKESEMTLLSNVKDMQITTRGHGTVKNDQVIDSEPFNKNKYNSEDGFSSAESAAVFAMGAALIVFVGGSYVFLSNQYHTRRKHNAHNRLFQDDVALMKNINSKSDIDVTIASTPDKSSSYDMNRTFETESTVSPASSSRWKEQESPQSTLSSPASSSSPPPYNMTCASSHPDHNGTGGNVNIVPVPLRHNQTETMYNQSVPARRYVESTSPFDVLYGAAFLHHDHERVQQSFQWKSNRQEKTKYLNGCNTTSPAKFSNATIAKYKKYNNNLNLLKTHNTITKTPQRNKKNKYTPKKPSTPITPMMSIAETDEGSDSTNSKDNQNLSYAFFPQIMNNITMYLGDKKYVNINKESNNNDDPTNDESGEIMGDSKDEFIVYRDFPRHDGTPFVMFTPQDEEKEKTNGEMKIPPQVCFNQDETFVESLSHASDSLASSMNSSLKEGIDSFVDKLEKLMAARSRQYEERVKMEKEREQRRKERKAKRPNRRRDRDRKRSHRYQALNTEQGDKSHNEENDTNNHQNPSTQPIELKENTVTSTEKFVKAKTKASKLTSQIDDLLALISDGHNESQSRSATAGKAKATTLETHEESHKTDLTRLGDSIDTPHDEIPVNEKHNVEKWPPFNGEVQDTLLQENTKMSSTSLSGQILTDTPEKKTKEDLVAPEDELSSTNLSVDSSGKHSVGQSNDQVSVVSDLGKLPTSGNYVETIQMDESHHSDMNKVIKSNTSLGSIPVTDVNHYNSEHNSIVSTERIAPEKIEIIQPSTRDESSGECLGKDDSKDVIIESTISNEHQFTNANSVENEEDKNIVGINENKAEIKSEKNTDSQDDTIVKPIVSGEIFCDDTILDKSPPSESQTSLKSNDGNTETEEIQNTNNIV